MRLNVLFPLSHCGSSSEARIIRLAFAGTRMIFIVRALIKPSALPKTASVPIIHYEILSSPVDVHALVHVSVAIYDIGGGSCVRPTVKTHYQQS